VVHSHFTVNGRKVNAPGQEVKAGDVIAVKEKSKNSPKFKEIRDMQITVPSWLTVDTDKLEGKVVALPTRADIDTPIAEHLIVELYSK
jgi:small subunit ribosomal protein S4